MKSIINGKEITLDDTTASNIQNEWDANALAQTADLKINGYKHQRALAYLDVGDQLDFLWHSMDSGEIPKSIDFYNSRLAVKKQFPKPAAVVTPSPVAVSDPSVEPTASS